MWEYIEGHLLAFYHAIGCGVTVPNFPGDVPAGFVGWITLYRCNLCQRYVDSIVIFALYVIQLSL